jgi:hypothetical protein
MRRLLFWLINKVDANDIATTSLGLNAIPLPAILLPVIPLDVRRTTD